MKVIYGDILNTLYVDDIKVVGICVTTNGVVKTDGLGVMGAGVAKDFVMRFPTIDHILGQKIKMHGNIPHILGNYKIPLEIRHDITIISFPTKNDWRDMSDINLIEESARRLAVMIDEDAYLQSGIVLLPMAGCHNGGLNWEDVEPVLERHLPNNVVIITKDIKWK